MRGLYFLEISHRSKRQGTPARNQSPSNKNFLSDSLPLAFGKQRANLKYCEHISWNSQRRKGTRQNVSLSEREREREWEWERERKSEKKVGRERAFDNQVNSISLPHADLQPLYLAKHEREGILNSKRLSLERHFRFVHHGLSYTQIWGDPIHRVLPKSSIWMVFFSSKRTSSLLGYPHDWGTPYFPSMHIRDANLYADPFLRECRLHDAEMITYAWWWCKLPVTKTWRCPKSWGYPHGFETSKLTKWGREAKCLANTPMQLMQKWMDQPRSSLQNWQILILTLWPCSRSPKSSKVEIEISRESRLPQVAAEQELAVRTDRPKGTSYKPAVATDHWWSRCRQCWSQICGACFVVPFMWLQVFTLFLWLPHLALDYSRALAVTWNFDSPSEHLMKANITSPRNQMAAWSGFAGRGLSRSHMDMSLWSNDTFFKPSYNRVFFIDLLHSLLNPFWVSDLLAVHSLGEKHFQILSKFKYPTHHSAQQKENYTDYRLDLLTWKSSDCFEYIKVYPGTVSTPPAATQTSTFFRRVRCDRHLKLPQNNDRKMSKTNAPNPNTHSVASLWSWNHDFLGYLGLLKTWEIPRYAIFMENRSALWILATFPKCLILQNSHICGSAATMVWNEWFLYIFSGLDIMGFAMDTFPLILETMGFVVDTLGKWHSLHQNHSKSMEYDLMISNGFCTG